MSREAFRPSSREALRASYEAFRASYEALRALYEALTSSYEAVRASLRNTHMPPNVVVSSSNFSDVARLPVIHASLPAHTHALLTQLLVMHLHTNALHTFHLVISENVARLQGIHTPCLVQAQLLVMHLSRSLSLFLSLYVFFLFLSVAHSLSLQVVSLWHVFVQAL